jgi:hypothetical protein
VLDFEVEVLNMAWILDMGSERHSKAQRRREHLQASDKPTFDSVAARFMADWTAGFVAVGWFQSPWPLLEADVRGGHQLMTDCTRAFAANSKSLTDDPSLQHMAALLQAHVLLQISGFSHVPEVFNPHACGGEAALAAAMDFYTWEGSGKAMKGSGTGLDHYRCAGMPLALCFGDLPRVDKWTDIVTAMYIDIDLPSTRAVLPEMGEIWHILPVCLILTKLNRSAQAQAVISAIGFDWSDGGLALVQCYAEAVAAVFPGIIIPAEVIFDKLLLYLVHPQTAAVDVEVSAWIPAPAALAQFEQDNSTSINTCSVFTFGGILPLAAQVFLKLGRDADAEETARIALSPERHLFHKYHLVECHCVLGQVAANRGNAEEAGGHFARALEEAKASRLPMLELVVARDWKRAVSEYAAADADAVIDDACAALGKSREQLASVL